MRQPNMAYRGVPARGPRLDQIIAAGRGEQDSLPSPARRGSRSRPPLRRPRPLRFERLRVPVWNPYSPGRLGPAKSEDRKGGEGKTDANLTHFFLAPAAPGTPTRHHALPSLPPPPPLRENLLLGLPRKLPPCPPGTPQRV